MIRPIDKNEIPGRAASYNCMVEADIDEFIARGIEAAEVDTTKYKKPSYAYNAYRLNIKRRSIGNTVVAMLRGDRVFLVRRRESGK